MEFLRLKKKEHKQILPSLMEYKKKVEENIDVVVVENMNPAELEETLVTLDKEIHSTSKASEQAIWAQIPQKEIKQLEEVIDQALLTEEPIVKSVQMSEIEVINKIVLELRNNERIWTDLVAAVATLVNKEADSSSLSEEENNSSSERDMNSLFNIVQSNFEALNSKLDSLKA